MKDYNVSYYKMDPHTIKMNTPQGQKEDQVGFKMKRVEEVIQAETFADARKKVKALAPEGEIKKIEVEEVK